jgi:hypothetical protein
MRSADFAHLFAVLGSALGNESDESAFDHAGAIIAALDILTQHASDPDFFGSDESDAFESACQEGLAAISRQIRSGVVKWLCEIATNGRAGVCYVISYLDPIYQREVSPIVTGLVKEPYLVCHLDFIAKCISFFDNLEGAMAVIGSLWGTASREKLGQAMAAVVKADAPRLNFELLRPMLDLTTQSAAAARALLPAIVTLVIALGDPGVESLNAIASAFAELVEWPTDEQTLRRLASWVVPIFRDSPPHPVLLPFFESLFRVLWPVLDGRLDWRDIAVQELLVDLVESVFPWGFLSTKDLWG